MGHDPRPVVQKLWEPLSLPPLHAHGSPPGYGVCVNCLLTSWFPYWTLISLWECVLFTAVSYCPAQGLSCRGSHFLFVEWIIIGTNDECSDHNPSPAGAFGELSVTDASSKPANGRPLAEMVSLGPCQGSFLQDLRPARPKC